MQRLYFATKGPFSGANLPYLKTKFGNEAVTEDAYVKLSWAMFVADGLGGVEFSSYHIANAVTLKVAEAVLAQHPNGMFVMTAMNQHHALNDFINSELIAYNNFVTKEILAYQTLVKRQVPLDKTSFSAATTFVSVMLDYQSEPNVLEVVQRGDSLAGVFRVRAYKTNQGVIFGYKPVFKSAEQQGQFNAPYNFANNDGSFPRSLGNEALQVYETDIVVTGSDGLWDNVPVPMITFALNALVLANKKRVPVQTVIDGLKGFSQYFEYDGRKITWGQPHTPPPLLPLNPEMNMKPNQYASYFYRRVGNNRNFRFDLNMLSAVDIQVYKEKAFGVTPPALKKESFVASRPLPSDYNPNLFKVKVNDDTGLPIQRRRNLAQMEAPALKKQARRELMRSSNYQPGSQMGKSYLAGNQEPYGRMTGQNTYSAMLGQSPYGGVAGQNVFGGVGVQGKPQYGAGYGQNQFSPNQGQISGGKGSPNQNLDLDADRRINAIYDPFLHSAELKMAAQAFDACAVNVLYGVNEPESFGEKILPDCFTNAMVGGFGLTADDFQQFFEEFNGKDLSNLLAQIALAFSKNKNFLSPFEANGRRWGLGDAVNGGKEDDITVCADMLVEGEGWSTTDVSVANIEIGNLIKQRNVLFKSDLNLFIKAAGY